MNYSFLDKLTIVIFTYNRHKYLKRAINYWSNYQVKLLILDGSDVKLNDPCLNSKNINYIHDTSGLHERLKNSGDYIDTEFTILSCDDEFYLPSSLCSCIKYLLEESEYSSCGGRALGFGTHNNKIYGVEVYPKLKDRVLNHDSPLERIYNHFYIYVPSHHYSVIRSEKFKLITKLVFEKKYSMYGGAELQFEFLVILSGKSKILPQLMWMRNKEVPQITFGLPQVKFKKWWVDKKYESEKKDFLNTMKKINDQILNSKNFKITEDNIVMLFELYISKPVFKKNPLKKIYNFMQHQKKKIIKFIFKREKFRYNSLIDQARLLASQGVSINYKELDNVISILQNSKDN